MFQTRFDWPEEIIERCVCSLVESGRPVRACSPALFRRRLLEEILEEATAASSGSHPQPWRVYVLFGAVKRDLDNALAPALRADDTARARQAERRTSFFDAPVGLIFSIVRKSSPSSWIELGLFAQNLLISAKVRGIDMRSQLALAPFHDLIAPRLHMPPEEMTAFGISLGQRDTPGVSQRPRAPRERAPHLARLLGFPDCRSIN